MRVLMFGWEFPPVMNGGLGTACRDLCTGLLRKGVEVTYVMPHDVSEINNGSMKFVGAFDQMRKIRFKKVNSPLTGYMDETEYEKTVQARTGKMSLYGRNLHEEVWRFGAVAGAIAKEEKHDIIHAHDWMTYPAAISAKRASQKPLVVHIHNTAFDRTAGHPNKAEYDIEYHGFREADRVIAISNRVKQTLITKYNVPGKKIEVVHWGIEEDKPEYHLNYTAPLKGKGKLVLFLGRVTIQKGPDYFIEAARKVADLEPSAKFVIAGDGDMMPKIISRTAQLGLTGKVFFTGALKGTEVHKAYQTADVFVMPSVSEPFGLVALEALKNNTPVIVSKTSGVSEVLKNCLKVDFWDTDALADRIVGVLRYNALQNELRENGKKEVDRMTLDAPAEKTIAVYKEVTR